MSLSAQIANGPILNFSSVSLLPVRPYISNYAPPTTQPVSGLYIPSGRGHQQLAGRPRIGPSTIRRRDHLRHPLLRRRVQLCR